MITIQKAKYYSAMVMIASVIYNKVDRGSQGSGLDKEGKAGVISVMMLEDTVSCVK